MDIFKIIMDPEPGPVTISIFDDLFKKNFGSGSTSPPAVAAARTDHLIKKEPEPEKNTFLLRNTGRKALVPVLFNHSSKMTDGHMCRYTLIKDKIEICYEEIMRGSI
jgi:hypothetical protein